MYQLIYFACADADKKQIDSIIDEYNASKHNFVHKLFWSRAIDGAFKSNQIRVIKHVINRCNIEPYTEMIEIMLSSNIDTLAARITLRDLLVHASIGEIATNIENEKIGRRFMYLERLLMKYEYDYFDLFQKYMNLTQIQIDKMYNIMSLHDCSLLLHKLRQYVDDRNTESKTHTVLTINWHKCVLNAMRYSCFDVVQYVVSFNYNLISLVIKCGIHRLHFIPHDNFYYERKQFMDYACKLLKQMPRYINQDELNSGIESIYEFNCIDMFKMVDFNGVAPRTLYYIFNVSMRISDEYMAVSLFNYLKHHWTIYDFCGILNGHREHKCMPAIVLWYRLTGYADKLNKQETREVLNRGLPIHNEHIEELVLNKTLFDTEIENIINGYLYGLIHLYDRNIVHIICSYDEFRLPETFT